MTDIEQSHKGIMMSRHLAKGVRASWLATNLGLELVGPDLEINQVSSLSQLKPASLAFSKNSNPISSTEPVLLIAPRELASKTKSVLFSKNPRLDFAKALSLLESHVGFKTGLEPAKVHPTVTLGQNVFIGAGATIGSGTKIYHNVVIAADVTIGENCVIKSGTVIGEAGFGFERDESGVPHRLPHLGSVRIGNNVELGSLNTVCRGTLDDTVVGDFVKTDDHVHIAHNCIIGRRVLLTACAQLSGGVEIGDDSWIAPNCSIMQKIKIGAKATVGLGAVVIRDVAAGTVVAGNPAKLIEKRN